MTEFNMDEHRPSGKFNLHEIERTRIEDGAHYDHCCCYFDDDTPMNLCNHHREPLQEIDRLTAEGSLKDAVIEATRYALKMNLDSSYVHAKDGPTRTAREIIEERLERLDAVSGRQDQYERCRHGRVVGMCDECRNDASDDSILKEIKDENSNL